jgi:hypothetical protein
MCCTWLSLMAFVVPVAELPTYQQSNSHEVAQWSPRQFWWLPIFSLRHGGHYGRAKCSGTL